MIRFSAAGLAAAVGVLLLATPAPAQMLRFELGQRLRAFEKDWDTTPDPAARKRTLEPLKRAINSFFSLNLAEAGRALDDARSALHSADPPSAANRWAASLYLKPAARLIDAADPDLPAEVVALYDAPAGATDKTSSTFKLLVHDKQPTDVPMTSVTPLTPFPRAVRVLLGPAVEGDFRLLMTVSGQDEHSFAARAQTISRVARLKDRLGRLREAAAGLADRPATVEALTLRATTDLLGELAGGATMETNYPAARLLREAEEVADAVKAGRTYYGGRRTGQFWLRLPLPESRYLPVRLLAPEAVKAGKPLPLVIALHGAGGSENLFFDGYGNGLIAQLGEQRGWLVVAPRSAGFFRPPTPSEVIDAVAKVYPVDRQRVFVVGHSMGAAQAVTMAGQQPELLAGVAPLGGGGQVRPGVKALPFFVGCGTEDFILSGARRLARDLEKAGVEQVVVKDYPDVEHLMVVQVALPDVFAWFDKLAAAKGP